MLLDDTINADTEPLCSLVQTRLTYKHILLSSYNSIVLLSSFHNYISHMYVCMSFDFACRLLVNVIVLFPDN